MLNNQLFHCPRCQFAKGKLKKIVYKLDAFVALNVTLRSEKHWHLQTFISLLNSFSGECINCKVDFVGMVRYSIYPKCCLISNTDSNGGLLSFLPNILDT